ncbi:hypothetical protein VNO78_27295 [Psophocarpus tetragonolobus]|uniref:Uncharacterized protein n=1 Tax=Psophocarpus tetragonolobus TaxID=3891 RepID=A0AAN9S0G7_PSOTE
MRFNSGKFDCPVSPRQLCNFQNRSHLYKGLNIFKAAREENKHQSRKPETWTKQKKEEYCERHNDVRKNGKCPLCPYLLKEWMPLLVISNDVEMAAKQKQNQKEQFEEYQGHDEEKLFITNCYATDSNMDA